MFRSSNLKNDLDSRMESYINDYFIYFDIIEHIRNDKFSNQNKYKELHFLINKNSDDAISWLLKAFATINYHKIGDHKYILDDLIVAKKQMKIDRENNLKLW